MKERLAEWYLKMLLGVDLCMIGKNASKLLNSAYITKKDEQGARVWSESYLESSSCFLPARK